MKLKLRKILRQIDEIVEKRDSMNNPALNITQNDLAILVSIILAESFSTTDSEVWIASVVIADRLFNSVANLRASDGSWKWQPPNKKGCRSSLSG